MSSFVWLRQNWLLLALILITGIIALFKPQISPWVIYDRDAVTHGQYWRLITGNLDHLNTSHWILNACGWVLVWLLYRGLLSDANWIGLFLCSSAGVGLGLYWFNTDLQNYVGLSGSLHGLFIAGAMMEARYGWRNGGIALLIILTAKVAYEQIFGSMPGTTEMAGGPVVTHAHLYGSAVGAVYGAVLLWRKKRPASSADSANY